MFALDAAPELDDATIDQLVKQMRRHGGGDGDIPAGYTYFAQFVDHDVTFDPLSKLGVVNDVETLVDFRTPRLDLDSLYGSGPRDQPFLYDWSTPDYPGAKLLVGWSSGDGATVFDLPRNDQDRALTGDGRNDENLILSQLHLLFIRFHNAVVDRLHEDNPRWSPLKLFEEARKAVRWHYQWIVVHDFLDRIVGKDMARDARAQRRLCVFDGEPFIPIEFSGAAYRFGHSMVRADYVPNGHIQQAVPIFADDEKAHDLHHLGGFRRLPVPLAVDWTFFFDVPARPRDPTRPQPSRKIDSYLEDGLFNLPAGLLPNNFVGPPELPRLNLMRGSALGLPAGNEVAVAMGVRPLGDTSLRLRSIKDQSVRNKVRKAPPLWYYILCEAGGRHGNKGDHLGPVGGRIVAEVLTALLHADPTAYVDQQPAWKPTLPRARDRDFTMADLIRFTLGDATDPFPARR